MAAAPAALAVESPRNTHKRAREDELALQFPLVRQERWLGWPGDNVFRLLVPAHKVGAIIGRKGEFVKRMCEDTKSRIKILDGIVGTSERVVLVSAREEPEVMVSPAIDGLLKVHQRTLGLIEGVEGYPSASADLVSPVASRLLVAATQAGSLIGKQGAIIKCIQDTSGVTLRIIPPEELPLCALQDDRIVEMHGEPLKVHKAVELAVSHLRKFLVDRSVLPLFEINRAVQAQYQPPVATQAAWAPTVAPVPTANNSNLGGIAYCDAASYQHNNFYQTPNLLEAQHQHKGISLYGRDPGIGSVAAVPVVTQVTQHMQVPLSYADAIIGVGGTNISSMRRASGAMINVQEAAGCSGEMTIELRGTSSQVQTAAQLVQNSMMVLPPSALPDTSAAMTGASIHNSLPSTNAYTPAPTNSAYSSIPCYNSMENGGYLSYPQPPPVYPSTAGHTTGTYGSYTSAYSY